MSRISTSPQSSRPGISKCPGLARKKETVRSASTTISPSGRPVAPSSPEGTSTATTVQSGRHVDGHCAAEPGGSARIQPFDEFRRHAFQRAAQARAEQRIHDEGKSVE